MVNKIVLTYLAADFVFVATGGLIMGFSLISESLIRATPTIGNVAQDLLLGECPLTAGVVNAVFIFVTFVIGLPALVLPNNRGWLRAQGWAVVLCGTFTLILGLVIWFDTLATRSNLSSIWGQTPPLDQSLLQEKFNCCGYLDSQSPPFIQDGTCPNALIAAQKQGCVQPFSDFANSYLDLIFTSAFGIVGIDVVMLLSVVVMIKHRQELERYRHIDEKNYGGI
ncbi:tetraspanin [Aulographum hederae CBS 113979]|uniref:Tetraspanin n=1 Tax=Aulographum hederae CBS 113979 TaxID=1176131 RepID=A0A6G1HEN1_9PEZI|nr:tetraspanin [Aulographum hederae CBS 113979]